MNRQAIDICRRVETLPYDEFVGITVAEARLLGFDQPGGWVGSVLEWQTSKRDPMHFLLGRPCIILNLPPGVRLKDMPR